MAEFSPTSTIYLCKVDWDNSYKHVPYFKNRSALYTYIDKKCVKTFSNYLTIRRTDENGTLISSVRVEANIDTLYGINYMYYQNKNHGDRLFFAFIKNFVYVNEHTTDIIFETDVFQTWWHDTDIKPCFVAREHSKSDEVGYNLVPEPFKYSDFMYDEVLNDNTLDEWGYLILSTENYFSKETIEKYFGEGAGSYVVNGCLMSGIYQGLYFWYYESPSQLNGVLNAIWGEASDSVLSICVVPKFCVSNNGFGCNYDEVAIGEGLVLSSGEPAETDIQISSINRSDFNFNGYTPINKKLYTSPFYNLVVTNQNGEEAVYNIEDFHNPSNPSFKMYGDVSASPSVTLIPENYKGIELNYDEGISISGFPQCSFVSDTFKLWLTKNGFSLMANTLIGAGQIAGGLIGGGGIGAGVAVSGANKILNTVETVTQQSYSPNKANPGSCKNNLLTAIGMNKFKYYVRYIKRDYARIVDNYFTMYGYQTNRIKYPGMHNRKYFTYVQTVGAIINAYPGHAFQVPNDDLEKMKNVFDTGVTFWDVTQCEADGYSIGEYDVLAKKNVCI